MKIINSISFDLTSWSYVVVIDGIKYSLKQGQYLTASAYCSALLNGIMTLFSEKERPEALAKAIWIAQKSLWLDPKPKLEWFIDNSPKDIDKSEIEKYILLE